MKKLLAWVLLLICLGGSAYAVTLSEIIRNCRNDGKALCPTSSYGKAMQACLVAHMKELSPNCKPIVIRLNNGEKFSLF